MTASFLLDIKEKEKMVRNATYLCSSADRPTRSLRFSSLHKTEVQRQKNPADIPREPIRSELACTCYQTMSTNVVVTWAFF